MSSYYIGIDPGQKGAIAILKDSEPPEVHDIPLLPDNSIDSWKLYHLLPLMDVQNDEIYCILEKAQSMPKQGVKGVFTYGIGYGKILAALEINRIPFKEIHPTKWKKHFSLSSDKKQSASTCMSLFPGVPLYGPQGGLKDGRAEALLMAFYAKQNKA